MVIGRRRQGGCLEIHDTGHFTWSRTCVRDRERLDVNVKPHSPVYICATGVRSEVLAFNIAETRTRAKSRPYQCRFDTSIVVKHISPLMPLKHWWHRLVAASGSSVRHEATNISWQSELHPRGASQSTEHFPTFRTMGLHMDDLHMPTVPSGPSSGSQFSKNADEEKKSLLDLIADKDRLEEELKALMSVLESVCLPISFPPPYLLTTLLPISSITTTS